MKKAILLLAVSALTLSGCGQAQQAANTAQSQSQTVSNAKSNADAQVKATADAKAQADAKAKADAEEHAKLEAEHAEIEKQVAEQNKKSAAEAAAAKDNNNNVQFANGVFTITDLSSSVGDYGMSYVVGTLRNETNTDKKYVMVEISLYDSDMNQVGSTQDAITTLDAHGTWKFKAPILEKRAEKFKIKGVTSL